MTDIEPCLRPQGHQRHRWFDGDQEVKCLGVPLPTATTPDEPTPSLPDAKGQEPA